MQDRADPSPLSAEDEAKVRALFQAVIDAWGAGDAQAYAALFTEDADYVSFDGVNNHGRGAIRASHQPLFEKYVKGSRLTGTITSIRRLGEGVALVHAQGGTILGGHSERSPERDSIQTLVAVKSGADWRFTAFHNGRVRPIGSGRGFIAWRLMDLAWRAVGPSP